MFRHKASWLHMTKYAFSCMSDAELSDYRTKTISAFGEYLVTLLEQNDAISKESLIRTLVRGIECQSDDMKKHIVLLGVSLDIESMVTPVFATLIFDDIIGLLKSIRRLNRATMSSAPDEPQKNHTASDEPFRESARSTFEKKQTMRRDAQKS